MTPTSHSSFRASMIFGATLLGVALIAQPSSVSAMGGDEPASGGTCSSKATKNACQGSPKCYWSNSTNTCKTKKNQSQLDQNERLYVKGSTLAKTGKYEEAIDVLRQADMSDPRVLNYIGYSYRKSGDLETAIGYYKTALRINPDFVLAREYLGEGYVKAGRLDLAKLELDEIAKRCGKGCKAYVELAAVIDGTDNATW